MKTIVIFLSLFFYSFAAQAEEHPESFAVYAGLARDDINIYRVSLQSPFDDWLSDRNIPLKGFFETSLNILDADDTIYGGAISPVFGVPLFRVSNYQLSLIGGIGVSFISETSINSRNLSSAFQFEDRLGLQLQGNKIGISALYLHYSNAGISDPNDGLDLFVIGLSFKI